MLPPKYTSVKNRRYSILESLLFPKKNLNTSKLAHALKGKTVLITGASFGIGEQLAYRLAFQETSLILVGRTEDKLQIVKKKIEQNGGIAEIFAADLRDEEQLDSLISYLKNNTQGIDIFVSNAGKSIKRSIYDSLDRHHDFTRLMSINYHAPVKLCLALIPILAKKRGHILNVSALNVLLPPMPKWAGYQASKSAFDQWFRSVAPELNAKQIAMTSVYLPLVKTRMMAPTKAYDNMPAMSPEHVADILANLIISRKKVFKPWWLFIVEVGFFLFKTPIQATISYRYKKKYK